jgi:hypothetical protein
MQLGEILVRRRLLNSTQLDRFLELQRKHVLNHRLGELLIEQGIISNPDLESALREQFWRQNGFWVID